MSFGARGNNCMSSLWRSSPQVLAVPRDGENGPWVKVGGDIWESGPTGPPTGAGTRGLEPGGNTRPRPRGRLQCPAPPGELTYVATSPTPGP